MGLNSRLKLQAWGRENITTAYLATPGTQKVSDTYTPSLLLGLAGWKHCNSVLHRCKPNGVRNAVLHGWMQNQHGAMMSQNRTATGVATTVTIMTASS